MDPTRTTLIELRDAIAVKQIGAVEAVRAYLERIERLNGRLNAFREVFGDRALERARQVDAGRIVGLLAGVPLAADGRAPKRDEA